MRRNKRRVRYVFIDEVEEESKQVQQDTPLERLAPKQPKAIGESGASQSFATEESSASQSASLVDEEEKKSEQSD